MPVIVDEAEYAEAVDCCLGWCPGCAEFTRESTEPDADDYDCPKCNGRSVVGAENALLSGMIELEDDES